MTKKDFVCRLASSTGVTKSDSEFMFDAIINMLSDALSEGEEVYLPKLGKLYVGTVAAHDSENVLASGGTMHIAEQRRARFRPAKELKERLNAS